MKIDQAIYIYLDNRMKIRLIRFFFVFKNKYYIIDKDKGLLNQNISKIFFFLGII